MAKNRASGVLDRTNAIRIEQQLNPPIQIGHQNVKCVQHFRDLGNHMSNGGDATADVTERIGKAVSVFQRLIRRLSRPQTSTRQ